MYNKVALITGAGTGVGQAAALSLQADGYRVVLTGRRREPLEETIAKGDSSKAEMLPIPSDVSDPSQVDATYKNGVFTVTLAKHAKAKPKRITVQHE